MAWQDSFQPEEAIPDANSTGQIAAQDAGAKPVTAPPANPLKYTPPSSFIPDDSMVPVAPAAPVRPQVSARFAMPAQPVDSGAAAPTGPAAAPTDNLEPNFAQRGPVGILLGGAAPVPDTATAISGLDKPQNIAGEMQQEKNAYAAKVANVTTALQQALGDKTAAFDPSTGLDRFGTRARMALFADNTDDRDKMLQAAIPGVQTKQLAVPGVGPMLVFKAPGDTSFHPVKGDNWSVGDLGDITGAAPAVATQVGTALATDGAGLGGRVLAQGLTGAGEDLAQQELGRATGPHSQSVGEDAASAGKTGVANSLAEVFASMLGFGKNTIQGKDGSMFKTNAQGQGVLDATDRLQQYDPGVKPPTFGAYGSPVLSAKEKQLASVSGVLPDKYDQIREGLAGLLSKSVGDTGITGTPQITNAAQAPGAETLGSVLSGMKADAAAPVAAASPNVTEPEARAGFADAYNTGKDNLINLRGKAYDTAEDTAYNAGPGGVQLNTQPLKDLSAEMRNGRTAAAGIPEQVGADPATGAPIMQPTRVVSGGFPTADTTKVLDKVDALAPTIGNFKDADYDNSAFGFMKDLRSTVGQNTQYPGAGGNMANYEQAKKLWGGLTDVMQNPTVSTPGYNTAIDYASQVNKYVNDSLDQPGIRAVLNSNGGSLDKFFSPDNFDAVNTARRFMPDGVKTMGQGLFTQLASEPERIPSFLKSFGDGTDGRKRVLDAAMTPDQQSLLSDYSAALDSIKGGPVQKMAETSNFAARPGVALDSGDASAIKDLMARSGGPNTPIGQNLRGAVFQRLLDDSTTKGKIDFNALATNADKALGNGVIQELMTPEELARIGDIRTMANAQGKVAAGDTQSGLHVGGVANALGIKMLVSPIKGLHALAELADSWYQSQAWGSAAGRRMVIGNGAPPGLAIRGATLGDMDYQKQQQGTWQNKALGQQQEPSFSQP